MQVALLRPYSVQLRRPCAPLRRDRGASTGSRQQSARPPGAGGQCSRAGGAQREQRHLKMRRWYITVLMYFLDLRA